MWDKRDFIAQASTARLMNIAFLTYLHQGQTEWWQGDF